MQLKSYFSGTVEAAMDLARRELGEDALLINARAATPETRYLGTYEVVFGVLPQAGNQAGHEEDDGAETPAEDQASARIAAPAPSTASGNDSAGGELEQLSRDLDRLRIQMERLASRGTAASGHRGLDSSPGAATEPDTLGAPNPLLARLANEEVDADLARRIAGGLPLNECFAVNPALGRPGATRSVIALVGPPGVGKTTTLVKLAARYGLACRKPAHILTADVYRIAAADQLRALASILGISCDVAETPVALAQLLEEHRSKELIFIDTPGLSFQEMDDGAELARLLTSHPEMDTHLVLSASMKPHDMARFADRYAAFRPKKLIFTRIDETTRYGSLVSAAARLGLPVSFLATGQQIPDDLEEATAERLSQLVLGADAVERRSSLEPGTAPARRPGGGATTDAGQTELNPIDDNPARGALGASA